jgi:anti-sigma B factor antagonist
MAGRRHPPRGLRGATGFIIPPAMPATVRTSDGVAILSLSGDLTLEGRERPLRDDIWRLLSEGRMKILVDLRAVRYLDSSAVGDLVASLKECLVRGAELKLLSPSDGVSRILSLTAVSKMIECHSDERQAVASFQPR